MCDYFSKSLIGVFFCFVFKRIEVVVGGEGEEIKVVLKKGYSYV